jgi:hypothetical protein
LLVACSSKKPIGKITQLSKVPLNINYGPTNSSALSEFQDVTDEYGLNGIEATNINIVDFNFDSYPDLVVIPEYYSQPIFYEYSKVLKKFVKITSLFPKSLKVTFLLFEDLNNDGIKDAVAGVLNQKSELNKRPVQILWGSKKAYRLSFSNTNKVVLTGKYPSTTISLLDYDLDGDLDIFLGNWFTKFKGKPLAHRDFFYINNKGKFTLSDNLLTGQTDKNISKKMDINAAPTMASTTCDIDQNGYPDILTASTNGYPNALWMNRFKFRKNYHYFKDYGVVSRFAGDTEGSLTKTGGGRTFSLACADYTNDGIMDVFVGEITHSYDSEERDKSSILTGSRKKFPPIFYRTEYTLDSDDLAWTQADKRALWFDYNRDGLLDLLVDNSGYPPHTRLILFKQFDDHSFENFSKKSGIDIVNPQSSVILDINKDGLIDILTSRNNVRNSKISRRLFLYKNTVKNSNRTIAFKLKSYKSNKSAIGAMVIVKVKKADGSFEMRRWQVGYSFGAMPAQNEDLIYFGLKKEEKLIHVKVRWPYSTELNSLPSSMEKVYHLDIKDLAFQKFVLCELPQKCS